ncbi:inner membrane insertion protein OxaA [Gottschalkia acidurici 9a]|uniref:Inner membrane insertion protein OxaA n=1 Tax=Gottschalkia acidurici (strain ATCC 7906 / DSM 604 / BCRC 14475 / CIP 104303 / KCTC 5404 / NCIMB 10678 / 9a) TaxID=1128398 RepID=K0AVX4_GOTA9|nr:membrane protein insertase YidC [Gottschalkia acidurici]AFS77389.1 inner membrane insertion protein OxaA [Gottschalkia acidurici 9a]
MSNLLSSILNILFTFTNDWGLSIALLTISVKFLLIPLSIKQKISMSKRGDFSNGINKIKEEYKNDEKKMNEELSKYYTENSKSLFGCFTILLQIPILMSLFKIVKAINIDSGSILVPWVSSLKSYDTYYIIPIIYALISIAPSLLNYISFLKLSNPNISLKQNIISILIMSIMLTSRSPVALGIYFITSSLVTLLEEIIYRLVFNKGLQKI